MTHIYNDSAEFPSDVIKGFAAAYPQYVQRVEGASGFVRAGGPLEGKVSLVIGGGSGHYPSYNGVVGTGFADGAVLGVVPDRQSDEVRKVGEADGLVECAPGQRGARGGGDVPVIEYRDRCPTVRGSAPQR